MLNVILIEWKGVEFRFILKRIFLVFNLVGISVCCLDFVIWVFGWSDMFLFLTTKIIFFGFIWGGFFKVFFVKVGLIGFGIFIGNVGVIGLLFILVNVVVGCLMDDFWLNIVLEVVWSKVGVDLFFVLGIGGFSLVFFGRRCFFVFWYSLLFILIIYVFGFLLGFWRLKILFCF